MKYSRDPQKYVLISAHLEPLFSVLFQFTLFEVASSKDLSLRESVASALFAMILAFPNTYNQLASQLITQMSIERPDDLESRNKLTVAFELLRVEAVQNPSTISDANKGSTSSNIKDVLKENRLKIQQIENKLIRPHAKALAQRKEFRNKFDKFLIEIIGILRIK